MIQVGFRIATKGLPAMFTAEIICFFSLSMGNEVRAVVSTHAADRVSDLLLVRGMMMVMIVGCHKITSCQVIERCCGAGRQFVFSGWHKNQVDDWSISTILLVPS
jgi:hypothetical protein